MTMTDPQNGPAPPLSKPLGVDVTGAIMTAIEPVSADLISRLQSIIDQAKALQELAHSHRDTVERYLEDRDAAVRSLITRHGELSASINGNCDAVEKAFEQLKVEFSADVAQAPEPQTQNSEDDGMHATRAEGDETTEESFEGEHAARAVEPSEDLPEEVGVTKEAQPQPAALPPLPKVKTGKPTIIDAKLQG